MKFSDFVCFEAIVPELKAQDRDGVIGELVSKLTEAGRLQDKSNKTVRDAILKRENEASTGMGKGVAVPHAKHSVVKEVVAAIGRSSTGIDFSSLDKQPVYSVILIISPTGEPEKHLQAMETLFTHLCHGNFRKFLRQLETVEQIKDLLLESDDSSMF